MISDPRTRLTGMPFAVLAVLTLLALASCGEGGTEPVAPEPPEPIRDVPTALAIHAGDGQSATSGTAVADPVQVRVTGQTGAALGGVSVSFEVTIGGGAAESATAVTGADGVASPGGWTLGTIGPQQLRATVSGLAPVDFTATATPDLTLVEGDGQEVETRLPAPVRPRVKVQDLHGNGVAGATVSFEAGGGSQVIPRGAVTDADGFATVQHWVMGPVPGVDTLTATLRDGDAVVASVTFTATATPAVYTIEVVLVGAADVPESHRAALEKTERFWESAITGNLPWSTVRKASLEDCLSRSDIDVEVPGDRVVDDLLIYVDIRDIDGPGGVFGGAGPCQIRADTGLPVVGTMFFDATDMDGLSEEARDETILHEMAHVIGFGTLWEYLGLLKEPKSRGGADPHFIGPAALDAFLSIGGDGYTDSKPVPVQSVGGPGVWDGHWRDFVFRTELMTSFIDRGKNPLSVVTLASFQDLGYDGVDLGLADEFTLPSSAMAPDIVDAGRRFDLGDHVSRAPIAVVDRDGRVIRYLTPRSR